MGRPSSFTQEIADEICERLARGESLTTICMDEELPGFRTVFTWLAEKAEFQQQYARAREIQAEAEFEKMLEIADTPQLGQKTKTTDKGLEITTGDMTEHRRLQVDTRKWILARMFPKKYGDATTLKHADPDGNALKVQVEEIRGNTE